MAIKYAERKALIIRTAIKQGKSDKYAINPSQLQHKEAVERMTRDGYLSKQNGQLLLTEKAAVYRRVTK